MPASDGLWEAQPLCFPPGEGSGEGLPAPLAGMGGSWGPRGSAPAPWYQPSPPRLLPSEPSPLPGGPRGAELPLCPWRLCSEGALFCLIKDDSRLWEGARRRCEGAGCRLSRAFHHLGDLCPLESHLGFRGLCRLPGGAGVSAAQVTPGGLTPEALLGQHWGGRWSRGCSHALMTGMPRPARPHRRHRSSEGADARGEGTPVCDLMSPA